MNFSLHNYRFAMLLYAVILITIGFKVSSAVELDGPNVCKKVEE